MAEPFDNKHQQELRKALERQIEQRRNVAAALAEEYKRGTTEKMREAFINIQNTIDALERAHHQENMKAQREAR
jgi:hypothetical protein